MFSAWIPMHVYPRVGTSALAQMPTRRERGGMCGTHLNRRRPTRTRDFHLSRGSVELADAVIADRAAKAGVAPR